MLLLLFVIRNSACVQPLEVVQISTASSHSPSIDEGGFNEPSPEIKAKLKPAYTYGTISTITNGTEKIETKDTTDETNEHTLHYVDFGYRLNPDGSESKHCFSDEPYETAKNTNENCGASTERPRSDKRTIHYPVADTVVYAAIKSEPSSLSPPFETKFNCGMVTFQLTYIIFYCDYGINSTLKNRIVSP